jgi:hypothetical protein
MSAKNKMLEYLKQHVGEFILVSELGKIAGTVEFTRSLRLLRQEGWDLEVKRQGGTTYYKLNSAQKGSSGVTREYVDSKTRYAIMQRDNSTCQRCGRTIKDGVKLAVDHKLPVDCGGTNEHSNLWVLCTECNGGKQASFKDFDAETLKTITQLTSTSERLKEFIRRNYGKALPVYILESIGRTREWTRVIRQLRQKGLFEYTYDQKKSSYTFKAGSLSPN